MLEWGVVFYKNLLFRPFLNTGGAIFYPMANKNSAIQDFCGRLHGFLEDVYALKARHVKVGWVDEEKEQKRAMPKAQALAKNAKRKKGKGEIVSNFDADFIGPGIKAASLATIAKVMNYGRAGGVNKDGHEYGAIPARPFVEVLRRKHYKPILREIGAIAQERLQKDSMPRSVKDSLTGLGVVAKGQLQRAMKDSNEYAPNAPITVKGGWMTNVKNGKPFKIEPKGSARPLWNHGTLINSVDFEIK